QSRFAAALLEAASDLRALIDDLGERNRVRGGRATVLPAPVAPADVLARLEDELRPRLADGQVAWEVAIDAAAPATVVSDASWLQRIGQQLARSALAAGAQHLWWRVAPAGEGGVALSLADDGEALGEEDRALLFEPFGSSAPRVRR